MNYKLILFFLSLNFIILACSSKEEKVIPKIKKEKQLFPVLKDTLSYTAVYLEATKMSTTSYKPISLGNFTDTVIVNHFIEKSLLKKMSEKDFKNYNHFHRSISSDNIVKATSENIKIIVDTTTIISKVDFGRLQSQDFVVKAHPVYILNISERDTVNLGFNYDIHARIEAKNKQNKWTPIEYNRLIGCLTGYRLFILQPNDTIITATPIFKGNFKTKLRLKLGKTFSNEFDGYINEE